jgi:hypothetical protein
MERKQLYALRYYIAFAGIIIGFYIYSGIVGWRWIGGASEKKNEYRSRGPHYLHK